MKLEHIREPLQAERSDLQGSTFVDVNLSDVSFTNVKLTGCQLENVNLSGARILDANLSHVSIDESCLVGMTIRGILVTELLALYEAQQDPKES